MAPALRQRMPRSAGRGSPVSGPEGQESEAGRPLQVKAALPKPNLPMSTLIAEDDAARHSCGRDSRARKAARCRLALCLTLLPTLPFAAGCAGQSARSQTGDTARPAAQHEARQESAAPSPTPDEEASASSILGYVDELAYN